MSYKLKEIFNNLEKFKYFPGTLIVINVMCFYETTNYLLTSKTSNLNKNKKRPIVVLKKEKNRDRIICALSTFYDGYDKRIEFNLKDCELIQKRCFDLYFDDKTTIFQKTTATKKKRKLFNIDINKLDLIIEKKKGKICGNCKIDYMDTIYNKIKNTDNGY